MEVIIRDTREEAAALTAAVIAKALHDKPNLVLGLATGRTMETLYHLLVDKHRDEGLSFAAVRTFNLDEYIGLEARDSRSYRYYMNHHLFSHVDIDITNTHLPNGMAEDIDAECAAYEYKIRSYGGIDLQLLGIGISGHVGFNEPLSAMLSRTRAKALTPQTQLQNAQFFGGPEGVPKRAITMGVGTILDSKKCILLATGAEKADIIAKAVEGPVTSMISATALQLHPQCRVIIDSAAASKLQNQDYYRWIFDNEPEWQEYA